MSEATRSRALRAGVVFLILWGVSLVVTNAVVERAGPLSPADGLVYADAFDRALRGQVTVSGDEVGYPAAEQFLCSPQSGLVLEKLVAAVGTEGATGPARQPGDSFDCRAAARDLRMGSTAWIHPPTYFFLQAGATRAVTAVLPDKDPFTVGRWLGTLWFATGGLAMVALGVWWGARWWAATAVVAALAPMGAIVSVMGYVTPDNAVLLVGALVFLAATAWWRGRVPALVLGLAGVLCGGLVKQTFVLAGIGAGLLLLALWWTQRRTPAPQRSGRETAIAIAWLGGGALVGVAGWQVLKSSLGRPMPDLPANFLSGLGPEGLLTTILGGLPTIVQGRITVDLEPRGLVVIAGAMSLLITAAVVGLLMYRPVGNPLIPIAVAGVGAATLGFTVLALAYSPVIGGLLPPATRYIMPVLPALVVPLLVVARRRWVVAVTVALGAAGLLAWYSFPIV